MKLFAPEYYKRFTCIADKCKHSCCVGWEIDIDTKTIGKYAKYNGKYSAEITESIEYDAEPRFKLDKDERCPHLDEKGLCKIILNAGEDYLCHICREHPRFYNLTSRGMEVGLGMACEEACRIILQSDDYMNICEIGEYNAENCDVFFDTKGKIEKIFDMLSDKTVGYSQKISSISRKYDVYVNIQSDGKWQKLLQSLEYLYEAHKQMIFGFSTDFNPPKNLENNLERALAYFIYRHCSEAFDEEDFRVSLGFCLFCERLLVSMCVLNPENDIYELARILSEEIEYSEENVEAIKTVFCERN